MIGSVGPIGQSLGSERVARPRAAGRYVEPVEAAGDRTPSTAVVEIRATRREETAGRRAASAGDAASTPFLAQLAALGLGDAMTGERRVRRDPAQIAARADALYRDGYRRVTDLEPGFFGAAEY
ncbi:hypothetical protein [Pleomorphomonas koreensis]|uniref:hypothetical protein n=1 Tax=Pleomorphomonas koreensis TaxID=257440 RepID=UPI000420315D|nr:hypothetical protein [Pleomorphomonas koreensis]